MNSTFSLKNTIAQRTSTQHSSMYSVDGATFQEWALSKLDNKGSKAHSMIGTLVTAINNSQMSVIEAKAQYVSALQS